METQIGRSWTEDWFLQCIFVILINKYGQIDIGPSLKGKIL